MKKFVDILTTKNFARQQNGKISHASIIASSIFYRLQGYDFGGKLH